jgi:hypothetical protein
MYLRDVGNHLYNHTVHFYPEYDGSMFHRNEDSHPQDNMVSQPGRPNSGTVMRSSRYISLLRISEDTGSKLGPEAG